MSNTIRKPWFAFIMGMVGSILICVLAMTIISQAFKTKTIGIDRDTALKIEETVIHDNEQFKVTVLGISETSLSGDAMDIKIENKTNSDYYVDLELYAINNIMFDSQQIDQIAAANSTKLLEVPIGSMLFDSVKLDKPMSIMFDLTFTDKETKANNGLPNYNIADIEIRTNYYGTATQETKALEGETILDKDGFIVKAIKGEEGFLKDSTLTFQVKNETSKNLAFYSSDVTFADPNSISPYNDTWITVRAGCIVYKQEQLVYDGATSASESVSRGNPMTSMLGVYELYTFDVYSEPVEFKWY